MTPLAAVAIVEGLLILGLLFVATWLCDQLDAERRRTNVWRELARGEHTRTVSNGGHHAPARV